MKTVKSMFFMLAFLSVRWIGYAQTNVFVNDSLITEKIKQGVANIAVAHDNGSALENIMDSLVAIIIPTVAIITPFLVAFLLVYYWLKFKNNNRKAKYEVMMKALEMGKDLPSNFFDENNQKSNPLSPSLTWSAVGFGLLISGFWIDNVFFGIGALCLFIGIAKFIAWKIENKNRPQDEYLQNSSDDSISISDQTLREER